MRPVDREPRVALWAAYGAICFIWGSTYLAIKVGLESFDPFFFAGLRYLIATVLGYLLVRGYGVRFRGPLRRWWPAFGVGVLFIGVCNGMVFWAETRLDSGYVALLITASPVWTAILTPLLPGERRVGAGGWLGILLALVGTVILLEPWRAGPFELVAALIVEASVVVWTAGSLWVRRVRERYHPFALTVAQMAAGATVLLVVAGLRGQALVGQVTWRAAAALGFLVVFGSLVAFGSYFYLLRHWEASRVATSTYVNPIVAVALGALVLSEPIHGSMVVGAVVVLTGVGLVLHEQHATPSP